MTLHLPHRIVSMNLRGGVSRLGVHEEHALRSVENAELRKVISEAVQSTKRIEQNFESLGREFPIKQQHVSNEAIVAKHIVPETLTGDLFVKGTITADALGVSELSAITANLGSVTAGNITGAVIRTAAEGARSEMDASGVRGIDASEVTKFNFDTATGVVTVSGIIISEAGSSLDGDHLIIGSVEANRLNVGQLSAITADLGTVTAGTITGGTIRTAASGRRAEMDPAGFRGYDVEDVLKFNFDTTTGILTAKAVISSETGSVIDTTHLAGQIKETQIADDAISTPKLQANSVTAAEINVANLAAINANLGTITAGTITGVTITASTFQTSVANPKVVHDSSGVYMTNGAGSKIVQLSTEGFAVTAGPSFEDLRSLRFVSGSRTSGLVGGSGDAESGTTRLEAAATSGGVSRAEIRATREGAENVGIFVESAALAHSVQAFTGGGGAFVIGNSAGRSDFLQLTTTAKRKINRGTKEVTLAKSATKSAVQTVAHGLGAAPTAVHVDIQTGEGGVTWGSRVIERGATNIKFQINASDALAEETTVTALWTAMT